MYLLVDVHFSDAHNFGAGNLISISAYLFDVIFSSGLNLEQNKLFIVSVTRLLPRNCLSGTLCVRNE